MKTKSYKYINLLIRIAIGLAAIWFIYLKLKDDLLPSLNQINFSTINYYLLFTVVAMLFLNWGLEALKWKYAIRSVKIISFKKAFKATTTGVTLGLITPNRIGEIPARALFLDKGLFKELTLKTLVSSFSQMLITLIFGLTGLSLTFKYFNIEINYLIIILILLMCLSMLLLYFKVNKFESLFTKISYLKEKKVFTALSEFTLIELANLLILSLLRYFIFLFQFYLLLMAFGVNLISLNEIMLIAVCFMITSLIPTILISEIGVRGSVALFVFGAISDMDVQIILASVLLWFINVGIPALLGVFNLKEIKIIKEN